MMIDTEFNIELNRYTGSFRTGDGFAVRVTDKRSGLIIVDARMTYEQFAMAIGGSGIGTGHVVDDGRYGRWTRRYIIKTDARRSDDDGVAELESVADQLVAALQHTGHAHVAAGPPHFHNDGTSIHVDYTVDTEPDSVVAGRFGLVEALEYAAGLVVES